MSDLKELCVNCGEPVENNSSFCSDECDFAYKSND
jgi:predicted nucleic acid-binding Zn ribbon protein